MKLMQQHFSGPLGRPDFFFLTEQLWQKLSEEIEKKQSHMFQDTLNIQNGCAKINQPFGFQLTGGQVTVSFPDSAFLLRAES